MSPYELLASAHVVAGTIALVTFWTAGLSRKGSRPHVFAGRGYLIAMALLLALAVPLTVSQIISGRAFGWFLAFLLVLTVTSCWTSWRAIRDKASFARYTGTAHRALGVLNLGSGLAMLGYGLSLGQPLFMGFSLVGVFAGIGMLRMRRRGPVDARWWLREHLGGMTGNAIATHISFFSIGLPRLFPDLSGPLLQNLAWFGPLVIGFTVQALVLRRWKRAGGKAPSAGSRVAPAGAAGA
jgi:hypothetical protein